MNTPNPAVLARIALVVASVLFVIFTANLLLAAFRVRLGLPVGPFLPRVPEFLVMLMACLAFAVATLLRERMRHIATTQSQREEETT